jgi:hypothetical protein
MTTMKKCKVCDSELIPIGAKLVCSNENCTYQEYSQKKSWFKLFADNDGIWSQLNQYQLPSVVAVQYERLRSLLQADELYGVQIKIKDIYETEVKFLVLVILSDTFNDDAKKKLFAPYIYQLMNSNPSLGTWLDLAKKLYKLGKDDNNPIYRILHSLIEYDNKEQIVAWRNANIGHGVLMPEDAQSFQDSLKEKVESLVSNYIENLVLYSEIRLCTKINEKLVDIDDQGILENTSEDTTELFILVQDRVFKLIPLIQCYKSSVYFFDSYIVKKSMTKYLSSSTNDKCTVLEKKLSDMFSSVKTILSIETLEDNADDGLFLEEQVKRIDEIVAPSVFFRYDFIKKYINDWIATHENGNFLIEMKAGMGKTTFVKMVDQLAYNNFQIKENTLCRAFYINSVYGYSKEYFLNSITKSLLITNSGEHITGDLAQINLESVNACNEFANNINYIFRYYQKKMGVQKLIIFIDGLDEIPYSTNSTIVDIIPSPDSLDKGIYFVCTSRLATDDVSTFTNNKVLAKLEFKDCLIVEPKTEVFREYKDNLLKSITKNQSLPISIGERLIGLSNVNALELQYMLNLYRDLGTDIFDTLDESNGFIDFYWKSLKTLFGETYYSELLKLVKLLVFIPVPISTNNIAELLGESNITFKLQAFLNTLKHWINSIRTGKNTLLQITRPEVKEWLDDNASDYGELLAIWKKHLDTYINIEIKALSIDELRILTIELLACLTFDVESFKGKYYKLLNLYLPQLYMYMYRFSETDNLLNYIFLSKLDEYIKSKVILFNIEFELRFYLALGTIFKEAGRLESVISCIGGFIDRLDDVSRTSFKNRVSDLYQLLAQCYDLMSKTQLAEKYFDLSVDIRNQDHNVIKDSDEELSIGDEYTSLLVQLQTAVSYKNNSNYKEALNTLGDIIKRCDKVKVFAPKDLNRKFDEILLNSYNIMGNIFKRRNPDKSLEYFKLAENLYEKLGGIDKFVNVYSRLTSLGQLYRVKKEYKAALKYYNEALQYIENTRENDEYVAPEDIVNVYNSIGNIYRDKEDYQKAILYYTKGINLFVEAERSGKSFDKTLYIIVVNNRRGLYHRLGLDDKLLIDTITIYKNYCYINWNKINHSKIGVVNQPLIDNTRDLIMENHKNDNYFDLLYKLGYPGRKGIDLLIAQGNLDAAIILLEAVIYEAVPYLGAIEDLAYSYGEKGIYNKAIEFTFLLIILCKYNYSMIEKKEPKNSLVKVSSLGVKGKYDIYKRESLFRIFDIEKQKEVYSVSEPNLDYTFCGKIGYSIPVYFEEMALYSLAIMFCELGRFAAKKIVSNIHMPLFPLLLTVDEKKIMIKQLKSWLTKIMDSQALNSVKATALYNLALKFYLNNVTENDRLEYIQQWGIINNDYILNGILELLPNIYISLELALRAIQYGSKEGKDLVVQIYNDKNFDNYNKSLVKYVEKLEFQFNA